MRTPAVTALLLLTLCAGCKKSRTDKDGSAAPPAGPQRPVDSISTLTFKFASTFGPADSIFSIAENGNVSVRNLAATREVFKQIPLEDKAEVFQKILALDLSGLESSPPPAAATTTTGTQWESISLHTKEKTIEFTATADTPIPHTVRAALMHIKDGLIPPR